MIDVEDKKRKIISFLETSGPALPVRVAKAIQMDPVFASAILSELLNEKKIKMSSMKIGSSSLYLIPGQEEQLENQTDNLKPLEKEAYLKLKNKKILTDEKESPAIRVALRNLKDFAIPFKLEEKILWKYAFISNEEIQEMLKPKTSEKKVEDPKTEKESGVDEEPIEKIDKGKKEEIKENIPKPPMPTVKPDNKKPKVENIFEERDEEPEFLKELENFLNRSSIKILEEVEVNKKEVVAILDVPSKLGSLNFLLVAKNKRTTNEEEVKSAIQRAVFHKMPCLYLIRKEPTKKIQSLLETNNLIKIVVMD